MGKTHVVIKVGQREKNLECHVTSKPELSSIFGIPWIIAFKFSWQEVRINQISQSSESEILQEFADLFNNDLGCFSGQPIKIFVKPDAQPKVFQC